MAITPPIRAIPRVKVAAELRGKNEPAAPSAVAPDVVAEFV